MKAFLRKRNYRMVAGVLAAVSLRASPSTVNPAQSTFVEISGLGAIPLARPTPEQLRPAEETLRDINARFA